MTVLLRNVSLVLTIIYFIFIFFLMKRKRIALKYSLLWLFSGIVMLTFVLFPEILIWVTGMLGIEVASNGLFIMFIGLIIMILVSLTVIVSDITERIKKLIQKVALLDKRLRELEEQNSESGSGDR